MIHRYQWVEHPQWGKGQVEWSVLDGAKEARVSFVHGPENAQICDLTPLPFLGPRWSFVFGRRGNHTWVRVRTGTPGSRALLGELLMTADEAVELQLALGCTGAVIERED